MKQLTGLDAAFLALETATSTGHVGSVEIVDPSTAPTPLTLDSFIAAIAPRMDLTPVGRRRLVEVPLGLDNPYWIDDPDFDIEYHVRELALPAPGSYQQLTEQVARLHARPLDRTRPLWEMYLISGLENGRVAIYTKIHHAAIDGVSGNDILEAVLDPTPEGRELPVPEPREAEEPPSQKDMVVRGIRTWASHPVRAARLTGDLVRSAPGIAATTGPSIPVVNRLFARDETAQEPVPASLRAPKTRFNAPITAHRRIAFTSVPLDTVKEIKNAGGSTVNDVVLALCAGGLRRWMDDAPADGPLIAGVPVSVRAPSGKGELGNQVSVMMVSLPTDLSDPVERLRAASLASRDAKEKFGAVPATMLMDVTQFSFPALANQGYRMAARLRLLETARPFNLIISNVPGPRTPLYLAGAELLEYYPISALADGQGLNITVFSYRDRIFFGLLGCRELTPDLDQLAVAITAEFNTLQAALGARPPR